MSNSQVIELREFQTAYLPKDTITSEASKILINKFNKQIQIAPPWDGTNFMWEITSKGWVGFIPITENLGFSLLPKVPLKNLFGMLSYSYNLKSVIFLEGEFKAETIQEFYDYLAEKLSLDILNRTRKGLFREYLAIDDDLPYIRGRINLRQAINSPWKINLNNQFHIHTADISFNQILSYTLEIILRSGLCSKKVLPSIRGAYRIMSRYSRPIPLNKKESLNFLYTRLNLDYRPMHILCQFFIEHVGPRISVGEQTMLPFLVDMWRLFELFVFEWLKEHLPKEYEVVNQVKFHFGDNDEMFFKADMVIKEKSSGKVAYILDTKYKDNQLPKPEDIEQVLAYAVTEDAKETVLIYPVKLLNPFSSKFGEIKLRCLSFCIEDDLEMAGEEFLEKLLYSQQANTTP